MTRFAIKSAKKSAFSLVELSVVIFIIGLMVAGVASSSKIIRKSSLSAARTLTRQSVVNNIPGVVVWYETTLNSSFDEDEIVDGGEISTWHDHNKQSLNKINATQGTSANKPLYIADAINGLPSLDFDGTSEYLAMNDNLCTETFTVFAVFQTSTSVGYANNFQGGHILYADKANGNDDVIPLSLTLGSKVSTFNGGPDSWLILSSVAVADDFPHIATAYRDMSTGSRKVWLDGANSVSDTNGSAGTNLTANMNMLIGGKGTGIGYYDGYLSEIIIFDRHLLTSERKKIEKYLSKKWDIII